MILIRIDMGYHTPIYALHQQSQAKMVDFGGWDMPLHYGSQVQEHHQVRRDAGIFDVSHMTVIDIKGDKVRDFLSYLLANDVSKLKKTGKALYSCMLNEQAGIIDDLITYFINEQWFRLVVNASTKIKDVGWIKKQAVAFSVDILVRDELAMLAIQGPKVREKISSFFAEKAEAALALDKFYALVEGDYFIARTGYTGEEGFEVICSAQQATELWQAALAADIKPVGLGARDTLRLEAGMNLYGSDMDETTTPLESALAWTVALGDGPRDFIGRDAFLAQKKAGLHKKLSGLLLVDKGVLRSHQKVITEQGEGEITSGSFAPTLNASIAFAHVPATATKECKVEIRGKQLTAQLVKPPFVRNGVSCLK
jgi:aminomethyltransferase